MSKIRTTVDFDYTAGQYKITALGTGSDWNAAASVVILDPKGFQAASIQVEPADNTVLGLPRGHASGSFEISFGGYNLIDNYPSKLYYSYYSMSTPFFNDTTLSGYGFSVPTLSGLVLTHISGLYTYVTASQVNDVYNSIPILVTRGDAVPHLYIDTVTNKNRIKYNSTLLTSDGLTGSNPEFTNCIGEILSGAYSGTRFFVTSWSQATTGIVIDQDASSWSGAYFKLMPYRTITSYSGWRDYSGQSEGIQGVFNLDSERTMGLGSIATVGSHIGVSQIDIGTALAANTLNIYGTVTEAGVLTTSADQYMYDIAIGDMIQYLESGSLSVKYGNIVSVTKNYPLAGTTLVKYWPTGTIAPFPNGSVNIYRANTYTLLNYPEFDKNYGVVVNYNGIQDSYTVKTPRAELELSANEFESTYAAVGDVAHFHIGPVHLSNGQVLPHNYLLRYKVEMYQGDVTSSSPANTWTAHGTMGTNVGLVTNGSYMKKGMYTATYSQALNASETLLFDITAGIGAGKIHRIVTIPVQPSA